ncbi:MAG: hypothetical protein WCK18_17555 [Prolixibacteraceae bacterium]
MFSYLALLITELRANYYHLHPEAITLRRLIEQAEKEVAPKIQSKNINFNLILDSNQNNSERGALVRLVFPQ